ncbi:MAG: hypothetical protein QF790_05465 [Gammaproteobacteria bacterium]|nr:hypothetical protein [Gammaproteobacteria bacterium]MDP6616595.1 hypothetical protein [Gammaproteobacteria bacterium]MDP6694792.1 hypothetical protein [Gammaproteobacteria bacterium]
MSGWFYIGRSDNCAERVAALRSRFSIAGVPGFNIRQVCDEPDAAVYCWMWKDNPDWADFDAATDAEKQTTLILDGYISDTGCYELNHDPDQGIAAGLLHLWLQHGERLIPELNGSFSLTLIDHRAGSTSVITDRWCSRPVWHGTDNGCLLLGNFSSVVATLFTGSLHIDKAGLWSLLAGHRLVAEKSLYREISRIGSGQLLNFADIASPRSRRWFDLDYRPDAQPSADDWGVEIAAAMRASASNLASTRTTNLFLSGGLDSRIAAGALGEGTRTTTIISQANLSSEIAERVATTVGSQHRTLYRDDNWYLSAFNAAALIAGGNYNVHHGHFFQAVPRLDTVPGETFILGDLAENFNTHYCQLGRAVVSKLKPGEVAGYYATMDKYTHKKPEQLKQVFRPAVADDLQASWKEEFDKVAVASFRVADDPRDAMDALFRWYDNCFCPTNMMLECIRPVAGHANIMFDNALFDLVQRVPADIKGRGILHRKILKHLDRRLLWIPNSNFWLPPGFPRWMEKANVQVRRRLRPAVHGLRKIRPRRGQQQGGGINTSSPGSWHVMHKWYWHDPAHVNFLDELISDESAFPAGIFDRSALRASVDAFRAGDVNRHFELYPLISLGLLNQQIPTAGIED